MSYCQYGYASKFTDWAEIRKSKMTIKYFENVATTLFRHFDIESHAVLYATHTFYTFISLPNGEVKPENLNYKIK